MDIVIFDLDGCLSDDRWRRELLPQQPHIGRPPEAFHEYNRRCGMDEPLAAGMELLDGYAQDVDVVVWFITARPAAYRVRTWEWLNKHFTFANTPVLSMRAPGDLRSSPELKVEKVTHLFTERRGETVARLFNGTPKTARIIAAFDDRDDVLAEYAKMPCMADALIQRVDADGVQTISHGSSLPTVNPRTAADVLAEMAETYRERNKVYGDNYKTVGAVMATLFPEGLELKTAADYNLWHLFELLIVKLTRFANSNLTHQDSIHDLAVYAAMVEAIIGETHE